MRDGEVALTIEPVVNYKQVSQAGVFCPFSRKFLAVGVDTHVHVAVPLKAEVTMKDGQYSVSLRTPQDEENQKEKLVFQLHVKPYTVNYETHSSSLVPMSKASNAKVIRAGNEQQQKNQ